MTAGAFADIISACRAGGTEIEIEDFRDACHRLARTLSAAFDDGLSDHLDLLLSKHDRLAAVLLIMPGDWGYRIERSCDCVATAVVELPYGQGLQEPVVSDEEGAALLGALANTLGVVLATPQTAR